MKHNKYFFVISSRAIGSFTIDLTEYQYNQLLTQFTLDLRRNEYEYKNGDTNIHLGHKYKKEPGMYVDEISDTFFDESVTYMMIKREIKN